MVAYMIVQAKISDEAQYGEYRQAVLPLIRTFGREHVRSGTAELLEGQQDERRIALFAFPSMEAIHSFWNSPEYVPVKALRQGAAILEIWAVPGHLPGLNT
jgi:uncharacterized protein (DUF1330 family)